jgi:hypothetical protein
MSLSVIRGFTMSNLNQPFVSSVSGATPLAPNGARQLYLAMHDNPDLGRLDAKVYLERALEATRRAPCDLPSSPADLDAWCARHSAQVGQAYLQYLDVRMAGAPRRYFPSKAAALYFLRAAAPTKLVDGSWLYGALRSWGDSAYHGLIRTYLEELGDGVDDKNHVVLYQSLLAQHGCDLWQDLPDEHFVQGAIQLALAECGAEMLPEMVGYNLGYEQLPLHLLITSYELNELGIDPYYFTLHVTVDNGSTGHARRAIDAVRELMGRAAGIGAEIGADADEFWRRVRDGYRLNDIGAGTTSIIKSFDLDAELVRIMAGKAVAGQHMHSDYCKIGGRSISDWLADPADMPRLLQAFQDGGWISRGQPAEASRFWGLVSGPRAQMFGVFSGYELQVLRDWIEHDPAGDARPARVPSFRARQRWEQTPERARPQAGPRGVIRQHKDDGTEGDAQLRAFERQVAAAGGKQQAMDLLLPALAPSRHHTRIGLMATRMFTRLLGA